jgi:4-amino-4-deoxychorismate lyase
MSSESALRDGNPASFELIETLRWEPAEGFVRIVRHLARLEVSARELGFAFEKPAVEQALVRSVGGDAPLRVRLTIDRMGQPNVTIQPFIPLPADVVWKLAIASTRLDSADPLLRHKTTKRETYEAARAEFSSDEADEVILLNEAGEVCEGTITSIFADTGNGPFKTPRLDCGLLAGVLRAEMLDIGKAAEAVLTPDDLRNARALYVGNSLRGLISARLA